MEQKLSRKQVRDAIVEMFANGELRIDVHIQPEYAPKGDGQWNVTKTILVVEDGQRIQIGDGNVDIEDPV